MLGGLRTAVILIGSFIVAAFGDEVSDELCLLQDGNFPNPDDCGSFIRCNNGVAEMETCPNGLLFNPFLITCDHGQTGNCSTEEDFKKETPPVETEDIGCPDDGPNIFPISSSCSEYYLCIDQNAYRAQCPEDLLFNSDKMTCDFEDDTSCDITSTNDIFPRHTRMIATIETSSLEPDSQKIVDTSDTPTETATDVILLSSSKTQSTEVSIQDETSETESLEYISTSEEPQDVSVNVSNSDTSSSTTEPVIIEETTNEENMKSSTSVSVTEFTTNKSPTVITVSTEQTEEGTKEASKTTNDPPSTKLIVTSIKETTEYSKTINDLAASTEIPNTYPDSTSSDYFTTESPPRTTQYQSDSTEIEETVGTTESNSNTTLDNIKTSQETQSVTESEETTITASDEVQSSVKYISSSTENSRTEQSSKTTVKPYTEQLTSGTTASNSEATFTESTLELDLKTTSTESARSRSVTELSSSLSEEYLANSTTVDSSTLESSSSQYTSTITESSENTLISNSESSTYSKSRDFTTKSVTSDSENTSKLYTIEFETTEDEILPDSTPTSETLRSSVPPTSSAKDSLQTTPIYTTLETASTKQETNTTGISVEDTSVFSSEKTYSTETKGSSVSEISNISVRTKSTESDENQTEQTGATTAEFSISEDGSTAITDEVITQSISTVPPTDGPSLDFTSKNTELSSKSTISSTETSVFTETDTASTISIETKSSIDQSTASDSYVSERTTNSEIASEVTSETITDNESVTDNFTELPTYSSSDDTVLTESTSDNMKPTSEKTTQIQVSIGTARMTTDSSMQTIKDITDVITLQPSPEDTSAETEFTDVRSSEYSSSPYSNFETGSETISTKITGTTQNLSTETSTYSSSETEITEKITNVNENVTEFQTSESSKSVDMLTDPSTTVEEITRNVFENITEITSTFSETSEIDRSSSNPSFMTPEISDKIVSTDITEEDLNLDKTSTTEGTSTDHSTISELSTKITQDTSTETLPTIDDSKQTWTSPTIKQTSTPELTSETTTRVDGKATSETSLITNTPELEVQSTDVSNIPEILTEITSDNYENITDTNLNFSQTSTSAVPSSTDVSSLATSEITSSEIHEYISTETSDNSISQRTEPHSTDSPSVTSKISPEITETQDNITNETPFYTETSETVKQQSTDFSSTSEIANVTLTSTSFPKTSVPTKTSVDSLLTTEVTSEIPKVFETTTQTEVPETSTQEKYSTDFSTSHQNYTYETAKTSNSISTQTTNTPDLSTKTSSDSETSITESSSISEKATFEPSDFTDTLRTTETSSTSEFSSETTNVHEITTDRTSTISDPTIRTEEPTDISVTSKSYDIIESSTTTKGPSTDSLSTYESTSKVPDDIATKMSSDSETSKTESFSTISISVASETSAPIDISRTDELSSTQLASTTKFSEITDMRETSTDKMSISVTTEQLTDLPLTSNSYDIIETSTFVEKSSTDTSIPYGSTKVNNDITTKMSTFSETHGTEPQSTIAEKVTSRTSAFNETSSTEELSSTQLSSTTEFSSEKIDETIDEISTMSETVKQPTLSPITSSSYITFETTTADKSSTDSSTTYEASSKVHDIVTKTSNNSETLSTESISISEKLTYETSAFTDPSRLDDLSSTQLSSTTELSPEITDVYETTANKFTMSEATSTEQRTGLPITSNSYDDITVSTPTTIEKSSTDGSISYGSSTKLTSNVPDDVTNTSPISETSETATEGQITTEETVVTEKPSDFPITSNSYDDITVETSTTAEKSSTHGSISYGSSTKPTSNVPDDVTNTSPISETSGTATEGQITIEETTEILVTTEYKELTSTERPTSSNEIVSTTLTISSNSTREPRFDSTSLPMDSTTTDVICISPSGFYPNPDDCNTFYQCSKGIPKLSFCTENFHFSPVQKACEEPCKAKCDKTLDCPTSATEDNSMSTTTQLPESTQSSAQTLPSSTSDLITTNNGKDVDISTSEPTDNTNIYTNASDATSRTTMNDKSTTGTESITRSSDITGVTSDITQTPQDFTREYTTDEPNITTEDMKTLSTNDGMSSDSTVSEITTISSISTNEEITTVPESTLSTNYESSSDKTDDIPSSEIPPTTETSTLDNISSLSTSSSAGTEDKNPSESYTSTTVSSTFVSDVSLSTSGTTKPDCEDPEDCRSTDDSEISTLIPYGICRRSDFLPDRNCERFINCTGTMPKIRKCAKGLHFNPTSRACDWPYKAGCGNIAEPLYEPDDSFTCPCRSCLIPSSENCQEYYLCLGFTAYPMKCSNNLLFDSSSNTCTYAHDVDCPIITTISTQSTEFTSTKKVKSSTTESTTVTSTTKRPVTSSTSKSTSAPTSKPFVCPRSNGLFKHPDNCGKFIQCSNRRPYRMSCPATLHFNVEKEICDYPCNAKCDLTLRCGSTTETPNDPRCPCRNCKLASDSTCTKYIECTNGIPRVVNCPWGQTFDTKSSSCDWAHKVNCQHSEICPRSNGLFPHEDCHKFVHCSNGIPYIKKCPYILEFDAAKQRCEWPNGRCKSTIYVKESDILKAEEHREGWKCPKSFGYFIEEQHCSKFYYCSLGTPSLKECSDELLYNPKIQNCDWKKNVRCDSHRNYSPKKCRMYNGHVTCPKSRAPLPHTHCNMYYDCSSGAACARRCPVGLYFNKTSGLCDKPVNVECFHPSEEQYSLKDFSLSCMAGDRRKMIDPADNACFYHCRHGHVISGCCPKGQIYNEQRDRCDRTSRTLKIRDVSKSSDSSSDSSDSSESL